MGKPIGSLPKLHIKYYYNNSYLVGGSKSNTKDLLHSNSATADAYERAVEDTSDAYNWGWDKIFQATINAPNPIEDPSTAEAYVGAFVQYPTLSTAWTSSATSFFESICSYVDSSLSVTLNPYVRLELWKASASIYGEDIEKLGETLVFLSTASQKFYRSTFSHTAYSLSIEEVHKTKVYLGLVRV